MREKEAEAEEGEETDEEEEAMSNEVVPEKKYDEDEECDGGVECTPLITIMRPWNDNVMHASLCSFLCATGAL